MKIESLDCNNCGAPVDVPENFQFMRCGHCNSRLKVHRETSAHYTEVLEEIQESTKELKSEVRALRLQGELRDLDDAWRAKRESMMVRAKDGSVSRPSIFMGVITGIVGVVGGGFFIAVTSSIPSRQPTSRFSGSGFPGPGFPGRSVVESGPPADLFSFFPLFGVLFMLVGIGMAIYFIARSREFDQAEAAHYERRRRLEERISRERRGG